MSDILIRDMEMPSDCDSCFIPGSVCPLWINTDVGSRHTDCPLIPVPPHGRLIDADALKMDLTRFYDGEVTAKHLIDEQPTIIPADPEKEE